MARAGKATKPTRPGRPPKQISKLNADAQTITHAIFAAAEPPDPNLRIRRRDGKIA